MPPQKKSGPSKKPPPSPLYGAKFDEGFNPELALDYQYFPKEAAFKRLVKALADGAKDIEVAESAKACKDFAGRVCSIFTQDVLLERLSKAKEAGVRVALLAEKEPVKATSPEVLDQIEKEAPQPYTQGNSAHRAAGSGV